MRRFNRPEMLDAPQDAALLAGDLCNLERINRFLGGVSLIRRQVERALSHMTGDGPLSILDVATGGGDLPRDLARWLRRRGITPRIVAVDWSDRVLEYARSRSRGHGEIVFVRGDARALPLGDASVDLVLCSLALHHFTELEAVSMLRELARVTRRVLIVNDLRRSPTACGLIWLLTRFSRNRMTRYDSPLSVRRAFTPAEMRALARDAGLDGARVERQPFFRQALVYERQTPDVRRQTPVRQ
jgi:2-polyprenyl-3-methyl-5-hydroxy-6-metoxy-1,4-benzoquinol methylase